jgi:hypothetical protein
MESKGGKEGWDKVGRSDLLSVCEVGKCVGMIVWTAYTSVNERMECKIFNIFEDEQMSGYR